MTAQTIRNRISFFLFDFAVRVIPKKISLLFDATEVFKSRSGSDHFLTWRCLPRAKHFQENPSTLEIKSEFVFFKTKKKLCLCLVSEVFVGSTGRMLRSMIKTQPHSCSPTCSTLAIESSVALCSAFEAIEQSTPFISRRPWLKFEEDKVRNEKMNPYLSNQATSAATKRKNLA
jgi:hypothetical protein